MSETILKVKLSEISTIRVHCKTCLAVVELSLNQFDRDYREAKCPVCRHWFVTNSQSDKTSPLAILADAMSSVNKLTDEVEVEFVVPTPTV